MEETQNPKLPDILYHYTSMASLFSLLNDPNLFPDNKKEEYLTEQKPVDIDAYQLNFWASHVDYLNDPSEGKYQMECLKQALRNYEQKNNTEDKSHLIEIIYNYVNSSAGVPFVVSLSENKEDLSMWRAYGDNGKGIILAFDRQKLETHFPLWKIKYLNMQDVVNLYKDEDLRTLHDNIEHDIPAILHILYRHKHDIKHPAYSHEQEWRLSVLEPHILCDGHRERNGLIIPYSIISISLNALKEIIIGPCAQQQLCARSLAGMIRKKTSIESVPITLSDVPYRIM